MLDALHLLAGAGRAAGAALWLPLAAWALLAALAELALRARRPHAALRLPVRRAAVWALPVALALPPLLHALWPPAPVFVPVSPPDLSALVPFAPMPAPASSPLPWGALASGAALVALGLVALREWGRMARALGALGRTAPAAPARHGTAARLRREHGLPPRVALRLCARARVPYTYGGRRPTIVLPAALAEAPEAARLALRHEMAHIARDDFARALAERALLAPLAPWLPPARLLLAGLALDRECLCDAAVLAMPGTRRADYARLLLSFADAGRPAPRLALSIATPPITQRLDAMQRPARPPRHAGSTGLALGGLVLAFALGFALAAPRPAGAIVLVSEPSLPAEATVHAAASLPDVPTESTLPPAADPITGRVFHADTRAPIAGANVQVQGTQIGAATGADGSFSLNAPGDAPGDALSVRVSAPGFEARVVVLAQGQRTVEVGLVPSLLPPDEVRQRMEAAMRERIEADRARAQDPEAQRLRAEALAREDASGVLVFEVVEEEPRLIGGLEGLQASIRYPEAAREAGIQGTVFVQFIVDPVGVPTQVAVVRSPNPVLSAESVRAVSDLRFEPGRQRGQPVHVRFTLPVRFVLPPE